MALSKDTASKIVDLVARDANCQRIIAPNPNFDKVFTIHLKVLEKMKIAGSVRNLLMMASLKFPDSPEFYQKSCLGVHEVAFAAIYPAFKQGKLPDVKFVGNANRKHWGLYHSATSIRMNDGTIYVFDWHATLTLQRPTISSYDEWLVANVTIYTPSFQGFK